MNARLSTFALALLLVQTADPAQADPQVGPNDFRVDATLGSNWGAVEVVATSSPELEVYLVAWTTEEVSPPQANGTGVKARYVDFAGVPVGPELTLFEDDVVSLANRQLGIAYDALLERFLVTFRDGSRLRGVLVHGFSPEAPIELTLCSGCRNHILADPSPAGRYLIAWKDSDSILAQRFDSELNPVGQPTIVALGGVNPSTDVTMTYNTVDDELLIAWRGDTELLTRRLSASDLTPLAGASPGGVYQVNDGDHVVVYQPAENEYLMVWRRYVVDAQGGLDREIFGQRLNAGGAEIGDDDFQISRMGRDSQHQADLPFAAVNPDHGQYLVVWRGNRPGPDLGSNEVEIFGQYLDHSGERLPPDNFRISELGPAFTTGYYADYPFVGFHPETQEFLSLFRGLAEAGQVGDRVFGQRLHGAPTIFADGFESGDASRW